MKKNEIYKIYGNHYKEMTKYLLEEANLSERIPKDSRIGIKPNLVSPTPAEYGATTHPEVVAGIIEYLQERDYMNIVMMEGSWIGDKTSDAYEYCGYRELSTQYQVPFIDAQKSKSSIVECEGMDLRICDCVNEVDFMINVPVLKGHGQTKVTCALKNMKGLIPNTEKRHFHTMGLHKPIAHLARGIRQDFIVVDHICGDLELEDGGNPIQTDCVMAAIDPVLVDSYVCRMLGYDIKDVEYITLAEELGIGSGNLSACEISIYAEKSVYDQAFFMKKTKIGGLSEDPHEPCRLPSENLLDISYAIEDADSCSACYASLAPAILRIKKEGRYEELLKAIEGKIAIGQGFTGENGRFGVGNCCRNFVNYVKGCPPEEEEVYDTLIEWMKVIE